MHWCAARTHLQSLCHTAGLLFSPGCSLYICVNVLHHFRQKYHLCAGFSYFHYLLTCWVSPLRSHEEIFEMQFVQAKLKFMSCLFAQNMVGKPLYFICFPQDNNPFLLEPEKHDEYEHCRKKTCPSRGIINRQESTSDLRRCTFSFFLRLQIISSIFYQERQTIQVITVF